MDWSRHSTTRSGYAVDPAKETVTLERTGLAPDEVRTYRMLLHVPAASAGDLAARLDLPMMATRVCLQRLEARGLVGRLPGAGQLFQAAPPQRAFASLMRRRRDELRTMRAEIGALAAEHRDGDARDIGAEPIDVLDGTATTQAYVRQLAAGAVSEVSALVADRHWRFDAMSPTVTYPGLRVRTVYPRTALGRPGEQLRINSALQSGRHLRVVDRPQLNVLLVDRSIALVPVRDGFGDPENDPGRPVTGGGLMVVHPGGLLDALLMVFEQTWRLGVPLVVGDDGQAREDPGTCTPTEDDLHLLRLLLDGLTDEAAAGKLDVSTRTVQRRVRDLIDLAGVRTRLQLIWEATRRGWI